ncbi:undecaprenyl-phosphate 4-deoxy-4-formamido-L-arabinose transferase [Halopseudomonas xinjiangensis]|uniref:Undecaprenyl-phosphate 4-deoxy-4-formamido-L-arabinose transferase n=1 Tax=Halopseudomonas xinjiangensis TaxID=487184 RepID=A0A1H1NPJ2_9GAMM|nr:glycosyltransferase family 2 protein [Halopseudomonas xinjiangensis]SDS00924.1 undecaprenyl-phosphate 4-deoxy-4-formamido-L-arabinose transferase [Halopseudomonas xinjiangensis]
MASEPPREVSIVIPVYGSEKILAELVRQVDEVMTEKGRHYEIIFVCDQSPDQSWNVITRLAQEYETVRGILLRMNAGQHNALMAGLAQAQGEIIVTMDDDLQHAPRDIPSLVEQVENGFDVAYGRFTSRKHPLWKIVGSRINNLVAGYLMHKPMDLYLSPFRAFKAVIRDEVLRYQGPYVYVDGLILTVTRNIAQVDVAHQERHAGDSRYGLAKSLSLWMKMATNFSIVPLRITSFLGLVFAGVGFLLALVLIIQKFTLDLMPIGWSSLIVTVLIIGGVQLLAVGMVGEYLGRALLTLNARPQYVVAQRVGGDGADPGAVEQEQKSA